MELTLDMRDQGFTVDENNTGVGGVAEFELEAPPEGLGYRIDRASVVTDSTTVSNLDVFVGSVAPENRREFTAAGNDDIFDARSPIWVPGGKVVIFYWSGLSSGAIAYLGLQWRLVQLVAGGGG